ncbi:hypothetical protein CAT7_09700 [Carnobacterium sp. AT7]|uniref:hypothetical protein n=1 Tax=Carnobacterium TaxID=2747 RepID=UPI00015F225F|nr:MULTISPECIES: hypothetical protein [Carnobacterium]EDP68306.1 hypothetical protein CAT7_09700 [Carnobacterium sp. AT7]
MKQSLASLQSKFEPFFFLRSYLILAPVIFFVYFAVNANLSGEAFSVYLTSQPMNPVMLLMALLSLFWFVILSAAQNQISQKVWRGTMLIFICSNVLTGNIMAIILGIMTMKQNVELKAAEEGTTPHLAVILFSISGFLAVLSAFVCFAFIRLTLI